MKKCFSVKILTYVALIIFIVMLLPLCYLSFINRASGDDYGYGCYTRDAWMTTHSLIEVGKAAGRTVRQYYYGWQGTWFSIFVFSLQPEVFSDRAYVITAFLMLFLWVGSTWLMFKQLLVSRLKIDQWSFRLITVLFLIVSIQFIPSIRNSVFWFNGGAHYTLPFAMCQLLVYLLLQFKDGSKGHFIGICILMTLLGGSNYQAALFALISVFYIVIVDFTSTKDKKFFWLGVPVIMELIGLEISMKAPGNKVRGGEEFGFSLKRGIETIGLSFVEGFRTIGNYISSRPLIFVGLVIIFLVCLQVSSKNRIVGMKHPFVAVTLLFCLYCAMYTPAIYAGVDDMSSGVCNMQYQVFLLMAGGVFWILAQRFMKKRSMSQKEVFNKIFLPGLAICFIILMLGRSYLKTSTWWISMEYILSGQAADYKVQMDLQTNLLTDEDVTDVVLPFINDQQGPLMCMPATDNPKNWTNTVIRQFYGKNSVVAMPQSEWEKIYSAQE